MYIDSTSRHNRVGMMSMLRLYPTLKNKINGKEKKIRLKVWKPRRIVDCSRETKSNAARSVATLIYHYHLDTQPTRFL